MDERGIDYYDELYRLLGCNTFQLAPKSKEPKSSWLSFQKEKNQNKIKEGNIAVVCGTISGNLVVVDMDNCDIAGALFQDWQGILGKTLVVRSSRGYHVYLRCANLPDMVKFDGGNNWHVDIKSEGGYVVGAGSTHPDGSLYTIISKTHQIMQLDSLDSLYAQLRKIGFDTTKLHLSISEILKGVNEGDRDDSAFRLACYYLRNGKTEEWTQNKMEEWNKKNKPPLESSEINKCFRSACSHVPDDERQRINVNHSQLADEIQNDFEFRALTTTHEILYYVNGVYMDGGEDLIKQECEKRTNLAINQATVSEVVAHVLRQTMIPRDRFDIDRELFNFKNGILNIRTGEFKEHKSSNLFRIQIPIIYDKMKGCVKFMKFLLEVLPAYEDRITIIEQFACCLLPHLHLERAAMYIGSGSNGKSTFLEVVKRFFGSINVSNIALHDLVFGRFAVAGLENKLVNIFADIPSTGLKELGKFKLIVSFDSISVEKKGKDFFDMQPFAKHFFSANQLPEIDEDTDAVFRRFMITEWNEKFVGDKRNINLIDELTTKDELSGILNLLLFHAKKLLQIKHFTFEPTVAEVRTVWRDQSNPVIMFMNEFYEGRKTYHVIKGDVYYKYAQWCLKNNYVVKTVDGFSKKLKKLGYRDDIVSIDKKATRVWMDIAEKAGLGQSNSVESYSTIDGSLLKA